MQLALWWRHRQRAADIHFSCARLLGDEFFGGGCCCGRHSPSYICILCLGFLECCEPLLCLPLKPGINLHPYVVCEGQY